MDYVVLYTMKDAYGKGCFFHPHALSVFSYRQKGKKICFSKIICYTIKL